MTARRRWLAAACLLLAAPGAATADPPTDCFGDPLPDGVAVRMGTVRCRHAGDVEFVGFLPDGKTILSFGKDDTMRWWDAESGKELRRWTAPAGLGCAAPSPDRRVLAAWVGDDVVLWDATSGKELWRLEKPDARRSGIAFSPDRNWVATCGERIRLWNAISGEHVRDMEGPEELFAAAAFLPDAQDSGVDRPRRGAAVVGRRNRQGRSRVGGVEGRRDRRGRVPRRRPVGDGGNGRHLCGSGMRRRGPNCTSCLLPPYTIRQTASPFPATASSWPRAAETASFACSTRPGATRCGAARAIRMRFGAWPFPRTGRRSSPAAATAPSASGTCPPGRRSTPSPGRRDRSRRWPCRRTARPWPRPGVDRRVHLWDAASGAERRSLEVSGLRTDRPPGLFAGRADV